MPRFAIPEEKGRRVKRLKRISWMQPIHACVAEPTNRAISEIRQCCGAQCYIAISRCGGKLPDFRAENGHRVLQGAPPRRRQLHFSECSRPFIQSVKSTLSHLKELQTRRGHPVKHRLKRVLLAVAMPNRQRLRFRDFGCTKFRKAPDTLKFLRHVIRATWSVRPKYPHRCVCLKECPLKPVLILKHATRRSDEQTSMGTKWLKHIAI